MDWLRGEWTVTRTINEGAGRFTGRARFDPDPHRPTVLIWHEHGRLQLGAHDGPAERTLRIEPGADDTWEVRFADGRPFHALTFDPHGHADAIHLCGADTYRGRFAADPPDRLTVIWQVTGPQKNDLIESVYERAA